MGERQRGRRDGNSRGDLDGRHQGESAEERERGSWSKKGEEEEGDGEDGEQWRTLARAQPSVVEVEGW